MSYKRLTKEKITKDNVILHRNIYGNIVISQEVWDMFEKEHNQLCELEDKIENGTLIGLPCKVGDTVYQITRDFVSEYKIKGFRCFESGHIFFEWQCIKGIYINIHGFYINGIGKTVFLTKAEAEKKLKELQKND